MQLLPPLHIYERNPQPFLLTLTSSKSNISSNSTLHDHLTRIYNSQHLTLSPISKMGNAVFFPCFSPHSINPKIEVVLWGGVVRTLDAPRPAGELMLEFPDQLVCHADSFYIGRPVPALSLEDELSLGETYLVIPADRLPCRVLTAGSLAALSSGLRQKPVIFEGSPFQHVAAAPGGEAMIKISKVFLTRVLTGGREVEERGGGGMVRLCSTPELRKHYEQLVGTKVQQQWSPRLETISERKSRLPPAIGRLSPARLKDHYA